MAALVRVSERLLGRRDAHYTTRHLLACSRWNARGFFELLAEGVRDLRSCAPPRVLSDGLLFVGRNRLSVRIAAAEDRRRRRPLRAKDGAWYSLGHVAGRRDGRLRQCEGKNRSAACRRLRACVHDLAPAQSTLEDAQRVRTVPEFLLPRQPIGPHPARQRVLARRVRAIPQFDDRVGAVDDAITRYEQPLRNRAGVGGERLGDLRIGIL